jgi:putative membrane protein
MHGFGLIFWLLIIIGLVGAVWFFGSLPKARDQVDHTTARQLLEERYARGEINREEYLQRKRDLEE